MMRLATVSLLIIWGGITSCSLPPDTALQPMAGTTPGDESVERVILLVGDAGESPPEGSTLFTRMREEVEAWSTALASDSAVTVLFLGDNVYPNGVHGPNHPDRGRDSLRLANQLDIVSGPAARRHGSLGLFLAGNHDWAGDVGPRGAARLKNQEKLILDRAASGVHVDLLPPALDPGPEVVDLGTHVKLVTVDTQWWLGNEGTLRRTQALQQVTQAVREPATRFVLFAAHHPLAAGGPHGGNIPFWPTLGALKLVNVVGANGQNLSALPYKRMIADFRSAFSGTDATVLYAAGHEHGLQVIRGTTSDDPEWTFVSGSGSKRSIIKETEGSVFQSSAPGYMRLLVGTGGGLLVEVVAESTSGFETVFSHRIR